MTSLDFTHGSSYSPHVQGKLARTAAERGRDPKALAREAIERFVDYDEWFIREVEKGPAQIDPTPKSNGDWKIHTAGRKFVNSCGGMPATQSL